MTKTKKLISVLLALVMLFSIVPAGGLSAFAETLGSVIVQLSGGSAQRHTVANYHTAYTSSDYQYGMATYAVPMDGYNGNPDICVPGLSSTDNMVPQGLTYWAAKNWILISAYEPNDAKASCVYALRADNGHLAAQFNLQTSTGANVTEHVSGIACSANNLYIADAGSKISYIPLSELNVAEGTVKTVRFAGTVNLNGELNGANTSYASFGDGILWTGNFYIGNNSSYNTMANASSGTMMLGYDLSGCPDSATEWSALQGLAGNPTYCIPLDAYGIDKVQCATVKNGFCYVGTSYGRTNDSQMYIFNVNLGSTIGNMTVNGHTKPAIPLTNKRAYSHLPMTEGLMIYDGYMWNIFESAAYLYNGAGSLSKNPTDVLWRFDISTLLGIDRENDSGEAATGDDQYKAASASCGDLSFIVPEVIYLTPTTANSSSFQYYANNTAAGAVVSGYETTGKIYYSYAGASSATLSYKFYNENLSKELSGGSVSLSSTTISSGNTGVSITGGTSPSVSGGGNSYIEWALTYTDSNDGKSKKAYAYTYVYNNNINSNNSVVADQVFQLVTANKKKNREILNWAIWISGISGIQSYSGDRADKYENCRYAYPPLTTSSINLKSGSSESPSNSDTIDGCYVEAAGNMGYTGYWWKDGGSSSGTERTQVSFYKGFIFADTSRISNTNQIPNLKVGLDIFENWGGENDGTNWWGLGYYASGSSENHTNLISETSSSGNNSNRLSGRITGNIKTLPISVSSLTSTKTYVLQSRGRSRNNGYEVDTKAKIYFDIIPINKANLRTAVQNAIKQMARLGVNDASHGKVTSLYFESDNDYRWVAFQHAYKNAVMALTRLDGSNDQALIDALNNALAALCTKVTVNANGGTVNDLVTEDYVQLGTSQSVSYTPSYTGTPTKYGYTFKGWSTSSTATSGNTSVTVGYNNTVYAAWEPNNYTISYNLDGGTVSGNPASYTIETSPVVLNNPTRTGYTFAGWTGSGVSTARTEVVVPNGVSTGLSAYTTSNPYDAHLRDHHFGNTFTVQPGATYRVYVTAKRASGTLNMQGGIWYTAQTSGNAWDSYSGEFTKLRDVSDGWAVYYKDITVPAGKQTGQFYIQIDQDHAGSGHGWLLADCAVVKLSLENLSYVANWTAHTYTVAYNGNGSTGGSTASSSHTYDTAKNLTSNGFERIFTVTYKANGGTFGTNDTASATATAAFKGWATSAGGAKVYDNSESVTNLSSTQGATVTLYAKWTDGSVTLPTNTNATRTGYTLLGWSTSSTATSATYTAGASYTPSADTTLYAVWQANTYTVAYNGNGYTGGSTASSSHTYDVAKALTANGYQRKFTVTYNANGGTCGTANATATATFNGWATSAGGAKVYDNSQSVTNLTDTNGTTVNLFAKWTDGSVTLPSASKAYDSASHYTFDGWYDAATGGNKIGNANASYTVSATKTLYAHYTPVAHNWDYPHATFNWSGFNCSTATVSCSVQGGHNKAENTTVSSSETTAPAYDAAGQRTYTAVFTENGTNYTDSKTDSIPALQTLINLDDVALEDVSGTSGKVALAPTKESDISFEIVGFVANGGSHTLYKAATKPTVASTLKLDGVRISIGSSGDKIEYKFTKMDFTTVPSFYALVKVTGTSAHKYSTNEIYTYQKITLVPAKNVMFDDTVEAITYTNSGNTGSGYGVWSRITDSGAAVSDATDDFGDIATAQTSTENSVKYSFGDAHKVSVSNTLGTAWPKAQFTFTGSGFDLISVTDSNSGVFAVFVYEGTDTNGTLKRRGIIDTYYGYSYGQLYYVPWDPISKITIGAESEGMQLYVADTESANWDESKAIYNQFRTAVYTTDANCAVTENGSPKLAYGWVISNSSDVLYQVPCISYDLGAVGTYTVVVEPRFTEMFGHYNENGDVKYYNLILDGVRIYNPAGANNEALALYAENGETYTYYELFRDAANNGASLVIDGKTSLSQSELGAYLAGAPKNELYLMPGGTAAFNITFANLTDAKIGIKAANGNAGSVTISNGTFAFTVPINTATEQYISIKSLLTEGAATTVTVTNSGSGIVSLTKLMTTTNTAASTPSGAPMRYLSVGPETENTALAAITMVNADIAINESTVETAAANDGTVTITLQTGADAETIVIRDAEGNVIDPDSITCTLDETGVKQWAIVLTQSEEGAYTYTLQAEYENGYTGNAEPTTVNVTVTFPENEETPGGQSFTSLLEKIRGFFLRLIELFKKLIGIFK